ncbi:MAG: FMN-binding protein [Gammaproteobacteria bacterium]|nr:MAG: FMN-binding protein [Gammaproteobacteria bacterium]
MYRISIFYLFPLLAALLSSSALARGVYLTPEAFLQQTFSAAIPQVQSFWLKTPDRQRAKDIFNRDYRGLRIRYWSYGNKSAWIFDEIGKTRPITIGVVIVDNQTTGNKTTGNRIDSVSILEFRESRGDEVRYPFFTGQFVGLALQQNGTDLDGAVDGITGATLSVRAVTRVARFALYLNGQVHPGTQGYLNGQVIPGGQSVIDE